MLQHGLSVKVGNQEWNIIALVSVSRYTTWHLQCMQKKGDGNTLTGFRRRMKNASALCVKNRVNLWTRMCSISSACLIRMLTRTLFTLGSIRTFSFSFRETVRGLSRSSGEVAASISGTLCRSDVWEAKFDTARAAVKDERTHWRYGLNDWDYTKSVAGRDINDCGGEYERTIVGMWE